MEKNNKEKAHDEKKFKKKKSVNWDAKATEDNHKKEKEKQPDGNGNEKEYEVFESYVQCGYDTYRFTKVWKPVELYV